MGQVSVSVYFDCEQKLLGSRRLTKAQPPFAGLLFGEGCGRRDNSDPCFAGFQWKGIIILDLEFYGCIVFGVPTDGVHPSVTE